MLEYIRNKTAAPYFSNLIWFIGNHIIELDECLISQAQSVIPIPRVVSELWLHSYLAYCFNCTTTKTQTTHNPTLMYSTYICYSCTVEISLVRIIIDMYTLPLQSPESWSSRGVRS